MSSGKKSWFFLLPPWMRHDEEEGTALVPSFSHHDDDEQKQPPASADDDDHPKEEEMMKEPPAAPCHEETTKTKEAGSSSKSSAAWWRLLLPTRGGAVGLVISGLIVLAVLLTTTTTWWTHLDYSSSSFLLGSSGNGGPHHPASGNNLGAAIPFSCGNDSNSSSSSSSSPSSSSMTRRMRMTPPPPPNSSESEQVVMCPDYFRYIHSDLSPWRDKGAGITREAVESARPRAAFRLTVVNGRAFVETYHRVFQSRDTFTKWGIAQLLGRYPGRVPDLDLMFNCEDMPEIHSSSMSMPLPPLFRYCKDDSTLDIVFPDWSFWGWPEVNIRPWAPLLEDIIANDHDLPWTEKTPYAYWKGNAGVSAARRDLLRCNGTQNNACLFNQDWRAAVRNGFKDGSNLAEQCRYRYKIFVQGRSWSVSQKYILACNSPVLLVDTPFRDFVSRGLVAGDHYWPIDPKNKCPAIKFAVDWGNDHAVESERMAEEGSGFARRLMTMDYVYDYMLHLLTEYAKLMRYKPVVPENAVELRPETVACPSISRATEFEFMMQSRETHVAAYQPCTMPPPFTAQHLKDMARRDKQVRDRVNNMMRNYYKHT